MGTSAKFATIYSGCVDGKTNLWIEIYSLERAMSYKNIYSVVTNRETHGCLRQNNSWTQRAKNPKAFHLNLYDEIQNGTITWFRKDEIFPPFSTIDRPILRSHDCDASFVSKDIDAYHCLLIQFITLE